MNFVLLYGSFSLFVSLLKHKVILKSLVCFKCTDALWDSTVPDCTHLGIWAAAQRCTIGLWQVCPTMRETRGDKLVALAIDVEVQSFLFPNDQVYARFVGFSQQAIDYSNVANRWCRNGSPSLTY